VKVSAIKCYEKAGFTVNKGQTKTTLVNGKKWISLNMTINNLTWEKLKVIKGNWK